MKINFKNKTFWVSLVSIVLLMVQNLSELFGFSFNSDGVMNVVNAICGVLIVLGILNNPTKPSEVKPENQTSESDTKI